MMTLAQPPQRLFKYQSFCDCSILNVKNSELYFQRPEDFNDPFDSNMIIGSTELSDNEAVEFIRNWIPAELSNFVLNGKLSKEGRMAFDLMVRPWMEPAAFAGT